MSSRGAYIESAHRLSKRTRLAIWGTSILLLVSGVVAFAITRGDHSGKVPQVFSNKPVVDVSKTPKTVKLDPVARRVVGRFILTAVARKNLREAYALAGPQIRQGMTLKQWLTGNIAVVPYPVQDLKFAPFKIDYSYRNHALIEVALLPTDKAQKQGVKPQIFFADLKRIRGHWFVDEWLPRASPVVPSANAFNG
jgi:hypothetical protein